MHYIDLVRKYKKRGIWDVKGDAVTPSRLRVEYRFDWIDMI